jgi:RNA polymerase sigma-70 factor (ECF subfamily)
VAANLLDDSPPNIAERIAAGESAAEDELAHYYARRVFALILARLHDPDLARDLTQDVLLGVLRALRANRLRDQNSLNGFVLGTARNLVSNYYREQRREPVKQEISEDLIAPAVQDHLELQERSILVRNALRKLNASEKEILRLTVVDRMPPNEIAGRLGLAAEVVRKRKSRALQKLTELVAKLQSHRPSRIY